MPGLEQSTVWLLNVERPAPDRERSFAFHMGKGKAVWQPSFAVGEAGHFPHWPGDPTAKDVSAVTAMRRH
jgi:hypothetical protein